MVPFRGCFVGEAVSEFTVKNWRQFQHYRDRNPPWIKLHFALLSSRDWVTLDDSSRVLAIACMLIASRNEGRVPADPEYIQRVAYLKKPPDFKPLIRCGFLESASDCKQMLATARPETETETETEPASKKPRKPAKTLIPDAFVLTDSLSAYVTKKIPDASPTAMFEQFCGQARQKGWENIDWDQAFQTYVRNAAPNSGHWSSGQYPRGGNGVQRWL